MTLLELTVVIVVILSLASILFLGAKAWKRGSDRAANLMNIRNIQQAARSHENLYGLMAGSSELSPSDIFITNNSSGYLAEPKPPSAVGIAAYKYLTKVPDFGQLYVSNVNEMETDYAPTPLSYKDW